MASKKDKKTSKASDSFNYKALGISEQLWKSASAEDRATFSILGSYTQKAAEANQEIPYRLTPEALKDLWNKAENDETIKQYYGEELNIAKENLSRQMEMMSQDFQQLTDKQKQDYVDAKKQLDTAQAAAGTLYSGFRDQAKKKLDKQSSDVIQSTRRQLQSQLNQMGSQIEQRFGSKALAGFNMKPLEAGTTAPIGAQANIKVPKIEAVGYKPLGDVIEGGITGSQEREKLADIEGKYQSLISSNLQQAGVTS